MKQPLPARLKKFVRRLLSSLAPQKKRRNTPQQLDLFPSSSPRAADTPESPRKTQAAPRKKAPRFHSKAPRFETHPPTAAF